MAEVIQSKWTLVVVGSYATATTLTDTRRLGPTHNEFGYDEHPAITSFFLLKKKFLNLKKKKFFFLEKNIYDQHVKNLVTKACRGNSVCLRLGLVWTE